MKTCTGCNETKPLDLFTVDRKRADGRNYRCRQCTQAASKAQYHRDPAKAKAQSDAWRRRNTDRAAEKGRRFRAANPSKAAGYSKAWRERNPGAAAKACRAWYWANREEALKRDRQQREARLEVFLLRERASYARRARSVAEKNRKWREKNKHRVAYYAAQRRSALAKRTPPWIDDNDLAQMQAFFAESRRLSLATGVLHHVDHIEPLRGLDASGLNVPWNLQVLTATENLKKGNRRVKT